MHPRTFITTLWKSLSDVQYYKQVLRAPLFFSLRFFLSAMLLLGLASGSVATIRDVQFWRQRAFDAQQELQQHFPSDLIIDWNGSALTSSRSPLLVPYPTSLHDQAKRYTLPNQMAIFEQTNERAGKDALLIVTPHTVSIQTSTGQFQEFQLSSLLPTSPVHIDKTTIGPLTTQLIEENLNPLLTIFAITSVIFFTLSLTISGLFIATVESALIFVVLSVTGRKLSYTQVWQLSLHVLVLAEIVHQVAQVLYPNIGISWLSISYWVIMTYVLLSLHETIKSKEV